MSKSCKVKQNRNIAYSLNVTGITIIICLTQQTNNFQPSEQQQQQQQQPRLNDE